MRLLVTGASGFIGKNFLLKASPGMEIFAVFQSDDFLDFLKENNLKNVTPVRCNLTDFQDVQEAARKIGSRFDAVVYLAGNRDPAESIRNPLLDLDSTVRALINFLENFSCEKFIFLSSGAVYDGLEGQVSPDSRLSPTLPYAISRLTAENYIRFFQKKRKSLGNYVILRFFDAYGPYEPSRKLYTKLVEIFALKGKKEFTIFGSGENYIDAMYVDDAVEGIKAVLGKKLEKNATVDFGTGNPMTLNEFVEKAARILGAGDADIKHTETGGAEHILFRASSEGMERLFSFKPAIKLDDGFARLAQHLKGKS